MTETPYTHGFDSILIEQLQISILEMDKERATALAERDTALAERDTALAERDTALAERDTALAERDTALAERDTALAERDTALAERDTALAERDTALAERDTLMGSRSWRATAWARKAAAPVPPRVSNGSPGQEPCRSDSPITQPGGVRGVQAVGERVEL